MKLQDIRDYEDLVNEQYETIDNFKAEIAELKDKVSRRNMQIKYWEKKYWDLFWSINPKEKV